MSQYLTRDKPTSNLLDCPHCGGRPEWRDGSSTTPYIRCTECGCRTPSSRDTKKLIAIWNRRADVGTCRITTEFTCSECGHQYPTRNYECYETCDGRIDYYSLGHDVLACAKPNHCPNCGARVMDE